MRNNKDKELEFETQNRLPFVRKRWGTKTCFFLILFFTLICSELAFLQAQNIKEVVYKNGYKYIPISYLTDTTTVRITHSIALYIVTGDEKDYTHVKKTFEITWFSICIDGRYNLNITPEQIYLASGHENPNPSFLYWVLPIDSLVYRQILNGFQKVGKKNCYFDNFYNEEDLLFLEGENEEEWWNMSNCDSLLEAQVDKFFLLMNEFITDNSKKLYKTNRIIPQNPIYYSTKAE